ncbi:carbon-nitrogen hydrolase family protein [uncultured Corynebacterium sp.]|uniref:carbon-nitrogen hydrolase family protein n=1 Tax=uncultured Corynebacterium sp. TaxID=159447 RepID=UPI0025D94738|nr:carbon-nitrogen hydrolase family protein [uncultured Corynebacterium sp.]
MKIAAVQFVSTGDTKANLELACEHIEEAASHGARLIVLPEATSQSFASGRLDTQAADLDGEFAQGLREVALRLGVTVIAGMFRPADVVERTRDDGSVKTIHRVFNTALVTGASDDGEIHAGYDKIHTYDAFDYRESDTVKPGEKLFTFDLEGLTIGVAICYDIRFPEQFKALARAGAQVIAVPFSWADGPGKREQWRLLSTARALDSTSFIVAAGQARPGGEAEAGTPSGPTGAGHSVIVQPDGVRLAESGYEDDILYADVDAETVARTRTALPVLEGPTF